jgi:hypothetical protein
MNNRDRRRSRRGRRRHRIQAEPDRGSAIAAYFLVGVVALFALAGLVLDGGSALAARGQAADVAQQAARAGANALDVASLRTGGAGDLTADVGRARAAAGAVLAAAGVDGEIEVAGSRVTVTTHVEKPTAILSLIGVDQVGGRATHSAVPLHGTTTGAR